MSFPNLRHRCPRNCMMNKFAQSIAVFGGEPNRNLRMKLILNKPEDAQLNLIKIGQHKVRIQNIGIKSCYNCGSIFHQQAQCSERPNVEEKEVNNGKDAQSVDSQNTVSNLEMTTPGAQHENHTPNPIVELPEHTPNNKMVLVEGRMVAIGEAGASIPDDEIAKTRVVPSAKEEATFAGAAK